MRAQHEASAGRAGRYLLEKFEALMRNAHGAQDRLAGLGKPTFVPGMRAHSVGQVSPSLASIAVD
jgi:hypothetical protein